MIRALMQKLGLDRIGELVADEVRRAEVHVLEGERDLLRKMLEGLDERIAGLGGKRRGRPPKAASPASATTAPTTKPPRRKSIARKPGETLQIFVLRAFRKARGPIQVAHLVKRVRQLGYRTGSSPKNLLLRIYHVLADEKLFEKLGKGAYALARPSPRPGTNGLTRVRAAPPHRRPRTDARRGPHITARTQVRTIVRSAADG